MSSQEPDEKSESGAAAPSVEEEAPAPEPQPAEPEQPVSPPPEEPSPEEEYEELIVPEKVKKPRKKRKHTAAIVTVVIILLILVAWTAFSPKMLTSQGYTYVNSPTFANLASFNGTHGSWAANTTWGVSVSGNRTVEANKTFDIKILITKVEERLSNFWFRGTAISITSMAVLNLTNVTIGELSEKSDLEFGKMGTVKVTLHAPGEYILKVTVQFLVYVDMRIGFLPVEKINLQPLELKPITVT